MTGRIPLDHLTSDQYDQLCGELDRLRADIAACRDQQWPQRLGRAEAALTRVQALADEHPAGIDTALIHEALDQTGPAATQATEHVYLSTGCYHGDHAYCQSMTGLNGAKRPGECKFCQAACRCGCHGETEQPAPLTPAEESRLAQSGIHTPGCDCGHDGMGVSWHGDDCGWRRGLVDCPGREQPGPG